MRKCLFSFPLLLVALWAVARENPKAQQWLQRTSVSFKENKGQILDTKGNARPDVRFTADVNGVQLFFRDHAVSYVFPKFEDNGKGGLVLSQLYRMDLEFLGANPSAQVISEEANADVSNYYLAHCPNGIVGVKSYRKVIYKNIYDKIDLVFYSAQGGAAVKYDFVVHPGGNVNDIQLRYTEAKNTQLTKDGSMEISNPLGTIVENTPYSYQITSGKEVEVKSGFQINNGIITFGVGNYDSSQDLVIDPITRVWGTYYGANALDRAFSVAIAPNGNVAVTGITQNTQFPVTPGAQQGTFGGVNDAFVLQFSSTGTLNWATFYGGSSIEQANGVTTDGNNNIFITGYSSSSNFAVTTADAQQGGGDVFVVAFNNNGSRLWSRLIGGNSNDQGNGIAVDNSGNIVVSGATFSANFPVTSGAFQSGFGGVRDGFAFKLTSSGSMQWCTYIGGSNDDQCWYGVDVDNGNNIFVAGSTTSTNFPVSNGSVNSGGTDVFIMGLRQDGSRYWSSYWGGTGDEQANSLTLDKNNNVIITGQTNSASGIASPGAVQSAFGGGARDAFVAKVSGSTGALSFATYYGGTAEDEGLSIATDASNSIFFTGITNSTNFPVQGALQTASAGNNEAFVVELNSSGTRRSATFWGGSQNELGRGIDVRGNRVMVVGQTSSLNFPVLNARQQNRGGNDDAFVWAFDSDGATDICANFNADIVSSNVTNCTAPNGTITTNVSGGTAPYRFNWAGPAGFSSTQQNLTGLSAGTYILNLNDAGTCAQTYSVTIISNSNIQVATTARTSPCGVDINVTGGSGNYAYAWSGPGGFSNTNANITVGTSGTYSLTVTDRGTSCTANAFVPLNCTGLACPVFSSTKTDIACFGLTDGVIEIVAEQVGAGETVEYNVNGGTFRARPIFDGLSKGDYTVRARVVGKPQCDFSASYTVIEPPVLAITTIIPTNISCNGANDGRLTVNVTGGTSPYTFSVNNQPGQRGDNVIKNLAPNTSYRVKIVDLNNCPAVSSSDYVLTQPDRLTATVQTQANVSCFGGNDGSVSVSVAGGTAPYSYRLNNNTNGQTSPVFTNLPSGNHRIIVTDANNCTYQANFTISGPFAPVTAGVAFQRDATCFGTADGSITATATGGTPPYRFELRDDNNNVLVPLQTGVTFPNLSRGNYTIVVRDANNCESSVQTSIFASPQIVVTLDQIVGVDCFGASTGAINLTITGGIPPYEILWSNGATSEDITGLPAGRICLKVTDALKCSIEQCFDVPSESGMTVSNNTVPVRCNGGNDGRVELTVNGGNPPYTFNWSNGTRSNAIGPVPANCYDVTITDRLGCRMRSTYCVPQPEVLEASVQVGNVTCNGGNDGSAMVDVTGGVAPYAYVWSNGSRERMTTGLSAGSISVTVNDANGCRTSALTEMVMQPEPIVANVDKMDLTCFNASNGEIIARNTMGGTAPYSYSIDGADFSNTSGHFMGLAAGDYVLTVRDSRNCTVTFNVTLTQPNEIIGTVVFKANIACYGLTDGKIYVNASNGTGAGFLYSLNDPQGPYTDVKTYDGLSKGINTVYIKDLGNNCILPLRENIEEPARLEIVNAVASNISCDGTPTATITITANGGTTFNANNEFVPYWYRINGGQWQASNVFSNLAPGRYTVEVRDHNLCISSQIVTVASGLNANVTTTATSCFGGNDGAISAQGAGGRPGVSPAPAYTYSLNNGPFQASGNFTGLRAGSYRLRVMDSQGCMFDGQITVPSRPSIEIRVNATPTTVCEGGSIVISAETNLGANANVRYQWLNADGTPIVGATQRNYTSRVSGTFWVDITNNATGCTERSQPISVTVYPDPHPVISTQTAGAPITVCKGDSVVLVANTSVPGTIYNWFKDGVFVQGGIDNVYSAYETGVYTVTVVTDRNCTSTSPGFTVIVNQLPEANIYPPAKTVVCVNDVISLQSSRDINWTYQWNRDGVAIPNTNDYQYDARTAGRYSVTITNEVTGCVKTSAPVTLTPNPLTFTATVSDPANCGSNDGRIVINATGNIGQSSYSVNNGSWVSFTGSATVSGLVSGVYNIKVRDAQCTVEKSETLDVATPHVTQVLGVTSNYMDIAWNPIQGARYDIVYRVIGSDQWASISNLANNVSAFTGAPIPSVRLTNLQHQSRYEVRVRAMCQGGFISDWSASERVTTLRQPTGRCFMPANIYVNLVQDDDESALAYWSIPVGGEFAPVCYDLEYRVKGTSDWFSLRVDATQIPYRLRNLLTSTTYEARMRTNCVNCPGSDDSRTSSYSPIVEFTTRNLCPEVGSLTLNGGTATETVCGSLELKVDNLSHQSNISYQWIYSSNGTDYANASGNGTTPTYVTSISGFYAVIVKVGNCEAVTSAPIELKVNAVPQVISNIISNVTCYQGNNGALMAGCTGENNVCLDANGNADYEFSLDGRNWKKDGLFSGLQAGNYTIHVRKISTGCSSTFTHPVFTTITEPGLPEIALEWPGAGNIDVTWSPISGASGYRIAYRIQGSGDNDWSYISIDEPYNPNNTAALTRTITGLQRNATIYEVRVQTRCAYDNSLGVWSISETIVVDPQDRTLGCLTPGGVFLSNITGSSCRVNWQPTGQAINYIVEYREAGASSFTVVDPVVGTSHTISGLSSGVQYYVRVKARCSNISGDISRYTEALMFATSLSKDAAVATSTQSEVSVYPNPNNGTFVVSFESEGAEQATLTLTDIAGRVVYNNTMTTQAGINSANVDVQSFGAGVYMLQIQQGTTRQSVKVVVN